MLSLELHWHLTFGYLVVTTHNHLVQYCIELVAIGMAVGLDGCIEPSE